MSTSIDRVSKIVEDIDAKYSPQLAKLYEKIAEELRMELMNAEIPTESDAGGPSKAWIVASNYLASCCDSQKLFPLALRYKEKE